MVGELRDKLKRERFEKVQMEKSINQEISEELNELMVEMEQNHK